MFGVSGILFGSFPKQHFYQNLKKYILIIKIATLTISKIVENSDGILKNSALAANNIKKKATVHNT
ncbi:hypothetical protein BGP_1255 [Beggiatoa sp. PS]|nr:hypothetical protein BGP_1255 [Beggiatoa sp. PS]